ncbi:MAG: DUF4349 domain-containing protein [Bacteroidota bacterium]
MKKLFFPLLVLFMIAACGGKNMSEKQSRDDKAKADSIGAVSSAEEQNMKDMERTASTSPQSENQDKGKAAANKKTEGNIETPANDQISQKVPDDLAADSAYAAKNRRRKLIKTADVKFRVYNVEKTTYIIEKMAGKYNGFIASSNLTSEVKKVIEQPHGSDSVLEIKDFYVENSITLRVPAPQLDKVLDELSKMFLYLDYRKITVEDVSISLLSNYLKAQNKNETNNRIRRAVDTKGVKLDNIVDAEESASAMKDASIDIQMRNLDLYDKIDFSTINIVIYQDLVRTSHVKSSPAVDQYRPSFWTRLGRSIVFGWNWLVKLIMLAIKLWPLYLIALVIYWFVRKVIKWSSKKPVNKE